MASADLLIDAFDRVQKIVHAATRDASRDVLNYRADPEANTIGWLVWHLTRVQDDHLADAFDQPQLWIKDGWAARFGLPFDDAATGYGQT